MNTQEVIKAASHHASRCALYERYAQCPSMRFFRPRGQNSQCLRGNDIFAVDVLAEPEIRQGIKEYSNWPTIPQLYINGEFVGGSDIVSEMYQNGELQKLLQE